MSIPFTPGHRQIKCDHRGKQIGHHLPCGPNAPRSSDDAEITIPEYDAFAERMDRQRVIYDEHTVICHSRSPAR